MRGLRSSGASGDGSGWDDGGVVSQGWGEAVTLTCEGVLISMSDEDTVEVAPGWVGIGAIGAAYYTEQFRDAASLDAFITKLQKARVEAFGAKAS